MIVWYSTMFYIVLCCAFTLCCPLIVWKCEYFNVYGVSDSAICGNVENVAGNGGVGGVA